MTRKTLTRVCIVLIIVSSTFAGVSPAQAQTDSFDMNIPHTVVSATYDPVNDYFIVLANTDGSVNNINGDYLYAYHENGTEMWNRDIVMTAASNIYYSNHTGKYYVVGSRSGGILQEIRKYNSNGGYEGGIQREGGGFFAGIDPQYGSKIGFRNDSPVGWAMFNTTSLNLIDAFSDESGPPVGDYYEPTERALLVQSTIGGNDGYHVRNGTTGNNIFSVVDSTDSNPDGMYFGINDRYLAGSGGMWNYQTGTQVRSWSESYAVAMHDTENIAYRVPGTNGGASGTIQALSPTTSAGSYTVPSGNVESLRYREWDGGEYLVYTTTSNHVGYVTAPTLPTIDGYIYGEDTGPLEGANATLFDTNNNVQGNVETNKNGYYTITTQTGNYTLRANKTGYVPETVTANFTDDITRNFTLRNKSLVFDFKVSNWMDHGTTQKYTAYVTDQGLYRESVTKNTTVTSANSSIISVDAANYTLVATSDENITTEVAITANYTRDGILFTDTQNVTVAPRTLDHIEDMPPEQWVPSFLGCGEDSALFCIGGEIQWIWLAVFIGSAISWFAKNEWVGVGVITSVIVLAWALGNVNFGVLMVAVFFALFVGYQLNKIPSRSDTDVGGDIGPQEPPEPPTNGL